MHEGSHEGEEASQHLYYGPHWVGVVVVVVVVAVAVVAVVGLWEHTDT